MNVIIKKELHTKINLNLELCEQVRTLIDKVAMEGQTAKSTLIMLQTLEKESALDKIVIEK